VGAKRDILHRSDFAQILIDRFQHRLKSFVFAHFCLDVVFGFIQEAKHLGDIGKEIIFC